MKISFISKLVLLALVGALGGLAGCANTSVTQVGIQHIKGRSLLVVPTGGMEFDMSTNSGGERFGLIGMALEAVATAEKRGSASRLANEAMQPDDLQNWVHAELVQSLRRKGWINPTLPHHGTLPKMSFTEWFNPDQRFDVSTLKNPKQALIIDYGFRNLTLQEYGSRQFANATIGLRVLDPQSGKVLGRTVVHSYRSSGFSGEPVLADYSPDDTPNYKAAVVNAFQRVLKQQINEAISQVIGENKKQP